MIFLSLGSEYSAAGCGGVFRALLVSSAATLAEALVEKRKGGNNYGGGDACGICPKNLYLCSMVCSIAVKYRFPVPVEGELLKHL